MMIVIGKKKENALVNNVFDGGVILAEVYDELIGHVAQIGKFTAYFETEGIIMGYHTDSWKQYRLSKDEVLAAKTIDGLLVLLETELAIKVVADAGS